MPTDRYIAIFDPIEGEFAVKKVRSVGDQFGRLIYLADRHTNQVTCLYGQDKYTPSLGQELQLWGGQFLIVTQEERKARVWLAGQVSRWSTSD